MFDVIVVGARVAGSSTAMLLARQGLRVLVVDRAAFPSDTLSTHQVQVPGGAALARWGLLDRVLEADTPASRSLRFDQGSVVLEGRFPEFHGVDAVYSPRRTILDTLLVDAAREAGAEVREGVRVEDIVREDGRVTGVRLRGNDGSSAVERAHVVVGADGRRSFVAEAVGARVTHKIAPRSVASYTYWSGVAVEGGELYGREGVAVGAWPTNDGLAMTYVAWPIARFAEYRADAEANLLATLDRCGSLGERVRAGRRAERIRTTPETVNRVRTPFGPGWALVGDAGLLMDPITGQGIGNAFHDAELLSAAIAAGLGGREPLDAAMPRYHRARDHDLLPMWKFTAQLAAFAPPGPETELLFSALAGCQDEIDRFFGVLTGSEPMREYLSPANLKRLIGLRGMAKVAMSKIRRGRGGREGAAAAA